VARGIFDYVQRDLTGPHGAFHSAEDADSAIPPTVGPALVAGPGNGLPSSGSPTIKKAEHAEGAFYVWAREEIDAVLGGSLVGTPPTTEADFFCAHYGVKPDGNVAHDPQGEFTGKNVLMQRQSLAVTAREFGLEIEAANEKLLGCLEKLRAVRARRPRPHLDDKVITAWNGLMISALARGHQILECHPERNEGSRSATNASWILRSAQNDTPAGNYLSTATQAAEFIERELYDAATGTVYRSWREGRSDIAGFAEDYAFLIQGLLDLYEAGFDIRWLQWAEKMQAKMDTLFWDAERGGYFNSRADDPTVIVRLKEDYDGAEPAPNSVAAMNLLRLDWMTGDVGGPATAGAPRGDDASPGSAVAKVMADKEGTRPPDISYRGKALRTLEASRTQWSRAPHALPQMLCALELALVEPSTVVLAGDPRTAEFQALVAVLHEKLGPRRVLLCADGGEGQQWLAARRSYLAEMKPLDGRATAYVCENFTCRQPVNSPEDLRALLE
jgi:uncharacterized protein YyaL (SSP411 family)